MSENKKDISKLIKTIFFSGIALILIGSVLIVFSFQKETLDNKYKVEKQTSYNSSTKHLSKGEIYVTKDIKYISNGTYKITYKTHYNNNKNINSILAKDTLFSITDTISDKYKLIENSILVNDKPMKAKIRNMSNESINVTYYENLFNIDIPSSMFTTPYTVEMKIKLDSREINTKLVTNGESYYSFTPSAENDFYNKKSMQSYIINGSAYIILTSK